MQNIKSSSKIKLFQLFLINPRDIYFIRRIHFKMADFLRNLIKKKGVPCFFEELEDNHFNSLYKLLVAKGIKPLKVTVSSGNGRRRTD